MDVRYDEVLGPLRTAYDARADRRDAMPKQPFKVAERQAFRDRLPAGARLLEVGAGTGQDSAFFQGAGLAVTAVDLSPAMVEHCRAKGIDAHVLDFLRLDSLPAASFDAVWAMNCLLHVPNRDLPAVLSAIHGVLRPGGLFFLGVWGGHDREGPIDGDDHEPPRFFAMRTDEVLLGYATARFELVDFHALEPADGYRFQSVTLRRAVPGPIPGDA